MGGGGGGFFVREGSGGGAFLAGPADWSVVELSVREISLPDVEAEDGRSS